MPEPDSVSVKEEIFKTVWELKKRGYADSTIVEKESTYHIVPKKFLGKENYWKVMQVVKNLRGEWVSQGKTSYWWVPKTETVEL